jgi:glutathione S-transferase
VARLYVILGSHACRTGMLMLEHKGIEYEPVTMPTGAQRLLRLRGFPGGTVPALVMNGQRVQTNRSIARFLDEVRPEAPLVPPTPEALEAERWADEVFQMAARRVALAGCLHNPVDLIPDPAAGPLGHVLWRNPSVRRAGMRMTSRFVFDVNLQTEQRLLAELPAHLDRIDGWLDAGVLGSERLHAADYAIAPSVALLTYRPTLKGEVEARPAGAFAARVLSSTASRAAPASAS